MKAERTRAATGILLTCALLSGCARGTGESNPVAEVRLSEPADAFFVRVESVESAALGTRAQQEGAQIRRHKLYATCMKEEGFGYEVPDIGSVRLWPPLYEPAWWARPSRMRAALGFGYSEPLTGFDEAHRGSYYQSLKPAQKAAWNAAFLRCIPVADRSPEYIRQQATARELLGSLYDALSASAGSTGFASIKHRYSTCMTDAGHPVTDPGELYDIAERASSMKAEVRIAKADVACRAPLADEIAAALEPTMTSWLAVHRERVDASADMWRSYGE